MKTKFVALMMALATVACGSNLPDDAAAEQQVLPSDGVDAGNRLGNQDTGGGVAVVEPDTGSTPRTDVGGNAPDVDAGSQTDDTGTDAADTPDVQQPDSGTDATDTASPEIDAGSSGTDAVITPDTPDSGGTDGVIVIEPDTGPDTVDSGTTDAGIAEVDAGAPDTGSPDTTDSGGSDAMDTTDTVDSGSSDVVGDIPDVDAGSPPDSADTVDVQQPDSGPDAVITPDTQVDTQDAADSGSSDATIVDPCQGKNCDDGNVCTDDSCVSGVCKHVANTKTCDDGDSCSANDLCMSTLCASTKVGCDDGNKCTVDSCKTGQGCIHTPAPNDACDDANACTFDSCNTMKGCVHDNVEAACDDANVCTVGDACKGGACTPGAVKSCDDGDECTSDTCDAVKNCQSGPVTPIMAENFEGAWAGLKSGKPKSATPLLDSQYAVGWTHEGFWDYQCEVPYDADMFGICSIWFSWSNGTGIVSPTMTRALPNTGSVRTLEISAQRWGKDKFNYLPFGVRMLGQSGNKLSEVALSNSLGETINPKSNFVVPVPADAFFVQVWVKRTKEDVSITETLMRFDNLKLWMGPVALSSCQ